MVCRDQIEKTYNFQKNCLHKNSDRAKRGSNGKRRTFCCTVIQTANASPRAGTLNGTNREYTFNPESTSEAPLISISGILVSPSKRIFGRCRANNLSVVNVPSSSSQTIEPS